MKRRHKPRNYRTKRLNHRPKPDRGGVQRANRRFKPVRSSKIKLIARFLFVGLINTVVGYAIYASLILLNVPYLAALLIATIMGVIFNFFSIGRLVFKSRGGLIVFGKFIAAYAVVYCINATALEVLIKHFQFDPYIGQALCVPLSVIISWLLMNYWVYKND
ncbi:MAG: GtrA family protein [Methylobacter sp.]|nr:GtrA family protein [Methylobacter sp.]